MKHYNGSRKETISERKHKGDVAAKETDFLQRLNTKKLGDNLHDVEVLRDAVSIEPSNFGIFEAIKMINDASMRDGSPMPGTGKVESVNFTADTTGHQTVWRPAQGEIYLLSTISVKPDGGTNSTNVSMSLSDGTNRAILDAGTGNISTGTIIDMVNGPVYISYDCFLESYIGTNNNGTTFTVAAHRVR